MINTDEGAWGSTDTWTAVEGVRIGRRDGDGPDVFSNVATIAVNSDGNIYVLDYSSQQVRVFDREGEHLITFGGQGNGPGELRAAIGMAFDDFDRLWVVDPGARRITAFASDGRVLSTMPRLAQGLLSPWPGGWDANEGLVDFGLGVERDHSRQTSLSQLRPVIVDRRDGAAEHLPVLERRYALFRNGMRVPFQGLLTTALTGLGSIWFAETDRYDIYLRHLRGDTVVAVRRTNVPLKVATAMEMDSLRTELVQRLAPHIPEVDMGLIPPTKPILERLIVDGDGHLMVLREVAGAAEPMSILDVFDGPTGRFLGSVGLPPRLLRTPRPVVARGSIYGVVADAFDVPYVVRIDLQGHAR